MKRATFLSGTVALAGLPAVASAGTVTTQHALFANLPRPRPSDWTRIIRGSGAKYQKQIGAGLERTPTSGALAYYEIQVGSPGGSCNPNSLRKAYLHDAAFGSLLDTYPLIANVGRTENFVYRYGDVVAGQRGENGDTVLRLLDESYLYDDRPLRIVSVGTQRIHIASRNVDTTHVVAEFAAPPSARQRLRHIELWHAPEFPFGVARYRATLHGLEAYELHVFSYGRPYKSDLALSLAQVRDMTKDGQYGQLPAGIGD